MPEINYLFTLAAATGGYLLGSISAAILVSRLFGLPDPRTTGSRNPGATNVLRSGNKKAAAATLAGDFLKGLITVLVVTTFADSSLTIAAAALGAFLGHLYPVYFRFQGGKGVATALGVLFGLDWITGLLAVTTWLATMLCFRISSLSALLTFAAMPAFVWLSSGNPIYTAAIGIMSALLFWRHRSNIKNLLAGTESKVGQKS